MRLRYRGRCHRCGTDLPAGSTAEYDRATRLVTCTGCLTASGHDPVSAPPPPPVPHRAGASARREYERRRTTRRQKVQQAHPRLGGLILALTNDPQNVRAWATGAEGEELLGRRLDQNAGPLLRVLHDRRIPGTRANLDHLAITPGGVHVIDAKKYTGRVQLRSVGPERRLYVGSRNCTRLVTAMHGQTRILRAALYEARIPSPVHGILCFVDAGWPLLRLPMTLDGVRVQHPARTVRALRRAGPLSENDIQHTYARLSEIFPPA
ncbi:nuclease-related domain-containing protein [Kineosporia mesophila]|nr:nuclease-related domain-containing protein [Kineosporia mesophila]MCD5349530.1 NERD domain-containing protein [Kineosporia mesophila]